MICDGAVTMRGAVHRLTARRPARRRTWERVSVAAVATVDRCDCASVSTDDGRTRWCQLRRSGQRGRARRGEIRTAGSAAPAPQARQRSTTFSVLDPSSSCSPPAGTRRGRRGGPGLARGPTVQRPGRTSFPLRPVRACGARAGPAARRCQQMGLVSKPPWLPRLWAIFVGPVKLMEHGIPALSRPGWGGGS
jgi:hypothetical protein